MNYKDDSIEKQKEKWIMRFTIMKMIHGNFDKNNNSSWGKNIGTAYTEIAEKLRQSCILVSCKEQLLATG